MLFAQKHVLKAHSTEACLLESERCCGCQMSAVVSNTCDTPMLELCRSIASTSLAEPFGEALVRRWS